MDAVDNHTDILRSVAHCDALCEYYESIVDYDDCDAKTVAALGLENFIERAKDIYNSILEMLKKLGKKIYDFWKFLDKIETTRTHWFEKTVEAEEKTKLMEKINVKFIELSDEQYEKHGEGPISTYLRFFKEGEALDFKALNGLVNIANKASNIKTLSSALNDVAKNYSDVIDYIEGDMSKVEEKDKALIAVSVQKDNIKSVNEKLVDAIRAIGDMPAIKDDNSKLNNINGGLQLALNVNKNMTPKFTVRYIRNRPIKRVPMLDKKQVSSLAENYKVINNFNKTIYKELKVADFNKTLVETARKAQRLIGKSANISVDEFLKEISKDISRLVTTVNALSVTLTNYMDKVLSAEFRLLRLAKSLAKEELGGE